MEREINSHFLSKTCSYIRMPLLAELYPLLMRPTHSCQRRSKPSLFVQHWGLNDRQRNSLWHQNWCCLNHPSARNDIVKCINLIINVTLNFRITTPAVSNTQSGNCDEIKTQLVVSSTSFRRNDSHESATHQFRRGGLLAALSKYITEFRIEAKNLETDNKLVDYSEQRHHTKLWYEPVLERLLYQRPAPALMIIQKIYYGLISFSCDGCTTNFPSYHQQGTK